jgi:UDP-GlcNAc:undecaprenyl-phosphate GlcNAc-1-phosphate transferase
MVLIGGIILLASMCTFFSLRMLLNTDFVYRLYPSKIGGRHIHKTEKPRIGGLVIIPVFGLFVGIAGVTHVLDFSPSIFYILCASMFILLYGFLDELLDLPWFVQIILQVLVAAMVIIPDTRIEVLPIPLVGSIYLDAFSVGGIPMGEILVTFVWIVGLMNVVNWLDGVDGLAGGVGVIASLVLVGLALQPHIFQIEVVFLAGLVAGMYMAFLKFNWYPSKIFMGTYGSMFLGFILAVISIYSGGKVATASLVMAFPIIDACFVVTQRLIAGKSIFEADTRHFHHKLLAIGFSPIQVVVTIYFLSGFFGLTALTLQTQGKVLLFFIGFVTMGISSWYLSQNVNKHKITPSSHENINQKRI